MNPVEIQPVEGVNILGSITDIPENHQDVVYFYPSIYSITNRGKVVEYDVKSRLKKSEFNLDGNTKVTKFDITIFNKKPHLVVGTVSGKILVFDPSEKRTVRRLRRHFKSVTCITVLPAHPTIFLSSGMDWKIVVWDLKTFKHIKEFTSHQAPVRCLCRFSKNDTYVLSGGESNKIIVHDSLTGAIVREIPHQLNTVSFIKSTSFPSYNKSPTSSKNEDGGIVEAEDIRHRKRNLKKHFFCALSSKTLYCLLFSEKYEKLKQINLHNLLVRPSSSTPTRILDCFFFFSNSSSSDVTPNNNNQPSSLFLCLTGTKTQTPFVLDIQNNSFISLRRNIIHLKEEENREEGDSDDNNQKEEEEEDEEKIILRIIHNEETESSEEETSDTFWCFYKNKIEFQKLRFSEIRKKMKKSSSKKKTPTTVENKVLSPQKKIENHVKKENPEKDEEEEEENEGEEEEEEEIIENSDEIEKFQKVVRKYEEDEKKRIKSLDRKKTKILNNLLLSETTTTEKEEKEKTRNNNDGVSYLSQFLLTSSSSSDSFIKTPKKEPQLEQQQFDTVPKSEYESVKTWIGLIEQKHHRQMEKTQRQIRFLKHNQNKQQQQQEQQPKEEESESLISFLTSENRNLRTSNTNSQKEVNTLSELNEILLERTHDLTRQNNEQKKVIKMLRFQRRFHLEQGRVSKSLGRGMEVQLEQKKEENERLRKCLRDVDGNLMAFIKEVQRTHNNSQSSSKLPQYFEKILNCVKSIHEIKREVADF